MPKFIRHAFVAVLLVSVMLCQGTWALASTTGGLSGTVVDTNTGRPVADATVTAAAPSQSATTTSDANGHFVFLSLAPDTYTVSSTKSGYDPASVAGISVFADSTQTAALSMHPTLKTIASVRSQAASSLVKSGTTADVYSVNAATQDKINALGGGGSLNSAYSAVASVPGVVMPLNQAGYFQTVHIRGGDYDQVGYEFDGVPVNRSFDNYPSGQLSSLGQSELQVYTGASPANSEGEGLAGYINQVIKSGTYPGFAVAQLGIGAPAFYHKASVEAGGASPNRLFSYYAGIGGYNQDFRYIDQGNATSYSNAYSGFGPVVVGLTPVNGCSDPSAVNYTECYANSSLAGPGGFTLGPYNWIQPSSIFDRDVVVNLHFGIPHHNDAGRDDVQVLWDSGMLLNGFYESVNDLPGGNSVFSPNSDDEGPVSYIDSFQWTGPVGTLLPANYSSLVKPYFYPSSPPHAPGGLLVNPNQRDAIWNNQEIVKLQYQKNFASNAYLRVYGYTYYSNWLQTGPVCAYLNYNCVVSPDYELSSHTRGGSFTFADQLSSQHLLTFEGNYTTANSTRDNNTQMFNGSGSRSLAAILVDSTHPTSGLCYNASNTSTPVNCDRTNATYATWACLQANNCATPPATVGAMTCGSGPCGYLVAENSLYATYNTVVPKFSALSLQDQWRPSSRWLFNIGVRADRFEFDGSSTNPGDPARQFWFNAFNLDNCVESNGFTLVNATTPGNCPAGTTLAHLTNDSAQVFSYTEVQPRLSGTYTASPNTVFRFSGGEYVEPPNTAYEQYNTLQEDLPGFLGPRFYKFGFTTPGHPVRPPLSYNYDLSWEQHLKGTDWSFKLTPFYRKTKDQIQNFFLDQATSFISGLNVGRQTSEGVEFAVNKGDFSQNGLSGLLSLTYTHSYINYDTLPNGTSIVSQVNNDIINYNSYTSFCQSHSTDARCTGGSQTGTAAPCYDSTGAPAPGCGANTIANPYWNAPAQSLLSPTANYATYDIFPAGIGSSTSSFSVPYVATLVLNYKHDRWAITPSLQFLAGNRYGAPETTPGIDPAAGGCTALGGSPSGDPRYPYGAAGGSPYNAMNCTGTITIPNPYTKQFDQPGAFVNPSQLLMNLQLSYDVSPKVTLIGTFANIVNTCFGGTKAAWTVSDSNVCSYGINNSAGIVQPVGNVYNPGATIQPFVQYPYERYLGPVNVDGFSTKLPFNFYLEGRIKI
ncbi:MAG TPA: TonB-dependent receptor [Candidatus Baltobacteraceae bacterium]|nr:TonB-dependent receptor [Candidatus Baltobacteraceae bacterium]